VLLENLVSGAPTLPISVLLFNEIREGSPEDHVDTVQAELDAPEPEP
jgi:DNA helicase-2/ATP-dependent DNA helicase PcrA